MCQSENCQPDELQPLDDASNRVLTHALKFTYLYLLARFKLKYRQISIITHTDFDGAISSAIILQKYPYSKLYFASASSLHKVLYVAGRNSSPDIPQTIFILDIGIPEHYRKRIIRAISDIRRHALIEIFWIDHHQSMYLDEMEEYVRLYIDAKEPQAAHLVYKLVNRSDQGRAFLDILHNAATPFAQYWIGVLKETVKSIFNIDMRVSVLRSLAKFKKTPFTQELHQRYHRRTAKPSGTIEKVYKTQNGYCFGLLPFTGDSELYPIIREVLRDLHLDFLLVEFEDGSLSAYKNRGSQIDLTPLLSLVGGKGHTYAFHFDPQRRITDEFFRPLNIPDLIQTVKEVL